MPVAGPITRLVTGSLLDALNDLGDQTGQMSARVHTALGDLQRALELLQGSAFAGAAAGMLAETTAALSGQLSACADASDSVSRIAYRCAAGFETAARQADNAAPDWGTLGDAATTLDTQDVTRDGEEAGSVARAKVVVARTARVYAADHSAASATTLAVTNWARATRSAATSATSQVAGVTQSVSDNLASGAGRSTTQWVAPTVVGPVVHASTSAGGGLGERRAAVAVALSAYAMGDHRPDARGQRLLALDEAALARDHPEWVGAAQGALAAGASDGDAQCVAFLYMVYALSQSSAQGSGAPLPKGNAETLWNAPEFAPPRWARFANGQGQPQPGDIMVLADGGPGQVAVITSVSQHPPRVTFANGMAHDGMDGMPREALHSFPMTTEGRVASIWGKQSAVLGFLRQMG